MKKDKVFWFDVETTGLYGWKHDIIQLAYMVEIDRVIVDKGVFTMQPMNFGDAIDEGALKIHGMSREDLRTFQPAINGHQQIMSVLDKYINKSDKEDKFIPAGYNVKFDMEFLQANFKKHNNRSFGSYFDYHYLDPMVLCNYLRYLGGLPVPNVKLATVAAHFGIPLQAHDAMEDIVATYTIAKKLNNFISIAHASV